MSQSSLVMKKVATANGTLGGKTSSAMSVGRVGGLGTNSTQPVTGLQSMPLGSVRGSSGAIDRFGGNDGYALNSVSGESGSINRDGGNTGYVLGGTSGNSGAVDQGGGNTGYHLGGLNGDSGAIDHGAGNDGYELGGTSGNPGAIDHGGGNNSSTLGGTSGDSGAINRGGGNNGYSLNTTSGNPGSISRGDGNRGYELGGTSGSSGAINSGGGNNGYGLNTTSGNSGAVSHLSGNTSYSLGGTRGNSGAVTRSGSSSGGLRSGATAVGGKKTVRRKPRPPRNAQHRNVCCGAPITGKMILHVDWAFDDKGNELPPKVLQWVAEIDGIDWTPPNWDDYQELRNKNGVVDQTFTETLVEQVSSVTFDTCSEWAMDGPDALGKRLGTRLVSHPLGEYERIIPAIPGRSVVPIRLTLWSAEA